MYHVHDTVHRNHFNHLFWACKVVFGHGFNNFKKILFVFVSCKLGFILLFCIVILVILSLNEIL